jgi:hypothetical protein
MAVLFIVRRNGILLVMPVCDQNLELFNIKADGIFARL